MTSHICRMELSDIHKGLSLALKLLSKVSPSMKSPDVSRRDSGVHQRPLAKSNGHKEPHDAAGAAAGDLEEHDDRELDDSPLHAGLGRKTNDMLNCIENSKVFFTEYVSRCLSSWLANRGEICLKTPEPPKSDGDMSHDSCGSDKPRNGVCSSDVSPIQSLSEDEVRCHGDDDMTTSLQVLSFTALCRYLVELSCFPSWKSSIDHYPSNSHQGKFVKFHETL